MLSTEKLNTVKNVNIFISYTIFTCNSSKRYQFIMKFLYFNIR
jgi:hypothetical protein